MIGDCESLSQDLIEMVRKDIERGKYIRFDYPVKGCYGIDGVFNLLFTGDRDCVRIRDYKNAYALKEIIYLIAFGRYRLIESGRKRQDSRIFDTNSIQEIYTADELLSRDEDRVLYKLLFQLLRQVDIFYLTINYCWFNFVDGLIHAPIMIYEDKVMISIHGNIEDCKDIENYFNTDKEVKEFFESMQYHKPEGDVPNTYMPTTIIFYLNEAGKKKISEIKGWFKWPIRLMGNICA